MSTSRPPCCLLCVNNFPLRWLLREVFSGRAKCRRELAVIAESVSSSEDSAPAISSLVSDAPAGYAHLFRRGVPDSGLFALLLDTSATSYRVIFQFSFFSFSLIFCVVILTAIKASQLLPPLSPPPSFSPLYQSPNVRNQIRSYHLDLCVFSADCNLLLQKRLHQDFRKTHRGGRSHHLTSPPAAYSVMRRPKITSNLMPDSPRLSISLDAVGDFLIFFSSRVVIIRAIFIYLLYFW